MSLIHNERTKLTATYLNGLAIALFAVGALSPLVAVLNAPGRAAPWGTVALMTICILASAALHWMARTVLGRLRP